MSREASGNGKFKEMWEDRATESLKETAEATASEGWTDRKTDKERALVAKALGFVMSTLVILQQNGSFRRFGLQVQVRLPFVWPRV